MNSRERVLAALRGEKVDRPPYFELYIDPKPVQEVQPGMSVEDFYDYADIDAVTCLTVAENPATVRWFDKDQGVWIDKWGAHQHMTGEFLSMVVPPARIETESDLANYSPPDPMKSPVIADARRLVQRFKGRRAIMVVGEAAFAPCQFLRAGLENLLIDFIERPDFIRKMVHICVEYHVELYRKLIAEGVEVVLLGDDYAGKTGPFMSPAHFMEFVLPELTAVTKAVHDAGGYVIKHTDGDIWKIMDMLIASGVDAVGPLEPAYMDLKMVRDYSGGRLGVMGNVDVDLLSRGTPQQVRAATTELLRRVSPGGGHIVSSGNTIASYVRGENLMAMIETVKGYTG